MYSFREYLLVERAIRARGLEQQDDFKDALAKNLEEYEQCKMDQGYRGSAPGLVKCPDGLLADPDPSVKAMSARVRSR